MTLRIDEKDRAIIHQLLEDSRQTTYMLGKKTGLPMTTVHNRITKLKKMGIIVHYTVRLDYKKLGRPILAYVGISVEYKTSGGKRLSQEGIAQQIKKLEGVQDVSILAGGMDIMIKVLATDIEDLNKLVTERLRNIEGVDKTQTSIVLKEV